MHGRKRDEYKALQRDTKVVAKLAAKSVAWHELQTELLQRRSSGYSCSSTTSDDQQQPNESLLVDCEEMIRSITSTLSLIEKAVTVNPDPLWLWNYRMELVVQRIQLEQSSPTSRTTNPHSTMESISIHETNLTTPQTIEWWWEQEQQVTQIALRNNPKSYGAWHYRKRCLQQCIIMVQQHCCYKVSLHVAQTKTMKIKNLLESELTLTGLFLQQDERNFHCWSYRRFVISCCLWNVTQQQQQLTTTTGSTIHNECEYKNIPTGGWLMMDTNQCPIVWMGSQIGSTSSCCSISSSNSSDNNRSMHRGPIPTKISMEQGADMRNILENEWAFTETKIRDNFSNFSAFHYRSKLLLILLATQDESNPLCDIYSTEFDLILNAVYTEPDDQTAWWYQRFLLETYMESNCYEDNKECRQVLQSHMEQIRELWNEYPTGKWILIGLWQCLQYSDRHTGKDSIEERCTLLEQLVHIDPDRKERYQHLLRKLQKERIER